MKKSLHLIQECFDTLNFRFYNNSRIFCNDDSQGTLKFPLRFFVFFITLYRFSKNLIFLILNKFYTIFFLFFCVLYKTIEIE